MTASLKSIEAPGRVLPTLNPDGSRRWLRPTPSRGIQHRRRRITAYALMLVFFLIPYLKLGGKPLILLDLPRREFTLLGTTFLPTETLLFMLLFVSALVAIIYFTALFGRVWCGWACPQTVYMEYLFRPIEYLIEGGPRGTRAHDGRGPLAPRRLLKHAVFLLLALFLAHTFLAYFVGVEQLAQWVRRPPVQHWTSFMVMLGTTALVLFDFGYFREQTCLVACPYGRLQSVLLDRRSLVVGYDVRRGEPRAKGTKQRPVPAGDCIDCGMCVLTCPTGIDIRDGLQMECIHCTQCMDACDAVMVKIGKPRGLIRYGSRDGLEGRASSMLRPRVVVYSAVLLLALGALGFSLATRPGAEVTLLRGLGVPYTLEQDGSVVNQIRVKIAHRGARAASYRIDLEGVPSARLVAPINPLPVAAKATASTSVFVVLPPGPLDGGEQAVSFRVSDGAGFTRELPYRLVGPRASARRRRRPRRRRCARPIGRGRPQ